MKLRWGRIVLAIMIVSSLMVGTFILINSNKKTPIVIEPDIVKPPIPTKQLEILDLESNTRPIAVMINNHKIAQPNQSGLNNAYLVYEIVVEGGITRMMAVFKDKTNLDIGTVRSSRHYFIDYALENDAIYTHFGWSPQAQNYISKNHINNINGMYDTGFWRNEELRKNKVPLEHTAYTSIDNIKNAANNRKYRLTSDKDNLLKYSIGTIDLSKKEGAIKADEVFIEYSDYQKNTFKYDEDKKVYHKYSGKDLRKDFKTKEPFHAKNIITYQVSNHSIDSYGRQDINNIGNGKGYFITNGYAVPITWEKDSHSSQTIYKYLDGEEIVVNDGITYIQIQPTDKKLEFKEKIVENNNLN